MTEPLVLYLRGHNGGGLSLEVILIFILDEGFNAIGVKTATHKRWGTVTVQDFGGRVIDGME